MIGGKMKNFPEVVTVKNISDKRYMPRKGKIRLGVKVKNQNGKEYPKETDYFVCPPEVTDVFGDKPKKLEIMLPLNDISKIFNIPKHTQQIQPYEFGHPVQKKTRLWLKNLPELVPTNIVNVKQSTKVPGNWFNKGGKERQKNRSKTFQGISEAMANQWG